MNLVEASSRVSARLIITLALVFGLAAVLWVADGNVRTNDPTSNASLLALMPAAFLAGVLSFLSPCTLPILPAYFAFTFQARKSSVVGMTIAFFLGLATTLTLLGATATALSQLLFQNLDQLTLVGGVVIMAFGVMSLMGKGFAGMPMSERPAATVFGSYLYGATFALGWTACVGPILGAILTLLTTQGATLVQGALLAFVYALGLGMPLILVATFFSRLRNESRLWQLMRGKGFQVSLGHTTLELHTTSILSGALLIAMGYLLASGQLTVLAQEAVGSDLSRWVIETEEGLRMWFGLR